MSKTKDTKTAYYNRSCSLMIKAYNEALVEGSKFAEKKMFLKYKGKRHLMMDIRYTVVWAVKNWSTDLRHSAWKYYRCSLIYTAELLYLKKALSKDDYEKIKTLLRKVKGLDKKSVMINRTSSGKKKSFNIKEIGQIDEELISSTNKWSNPLRIWIRAAKYTGLRPVEWRSVVYSKETNEIIVKNAKHTNGRSFGKERTISLKHLEKYKIDDIILHIKISDAMVESNNWEQYYKGCSNLLRYSARKIWPKKAKYPTLYSCRHQFSADMKASGCTKREVAALMGHASDLTAQEHYGRKKHGVSGKKPDVSKNDLKMVRSGDKKDFKFENKND